MRTQWFGSSPAVDRFHRSAVPVLPSSLPGDPQLCRIFIYDPTVKRRKAHDVGRWGNGTLLYRFPGTPEWRVNFDFDGRRMAN